MFAPHHRDEEIVVVRMLCREEDHCAQRRTRRRRIGRTDRRRRGAVPALGAVAVQRDRRAVRQGRWRSSRARASRRTSVDRPAACCRSSTASSTQQKVTSGGRMLLEPGLHPGGGRRDQSHGSPWWPDRRRQRRDHRHADSVGADRGCARRGRPGGRRPAGLPRRPARPRTTAAACLTAPGQLSGTSVPTYLLRSS